MSLFGNAAREGESLHQVICGIGEPAEQRALVQYVVPDSKGRSHWGVLLLTAYAVHVVHGESSNWLSELIRPGRSGHTRLSVEIGAIDAIDLPPRARGLRRLVAGPTVLVAIRRRDGTSLRLRVDDTARPLLEEARRRITDHGPADR